MSEAQATQPEVTMLPSDRRAFHSPSAWTRLLLVLVIGLVADLGSKSWSFENVADTPVRLNRADLLSDPNYNPIPRHDSVTILPLQLLNLQLVINRGAVFGIGSDKRIFFIVFTLFALGAGFFVFGRYTQQRHLLSHFALGLILAGGLGNLYDRISFGVVRDFLHMLPGWNLPFGWRWWGGSPNLFPWVFNVADVMLLLGIGLLMIHIHRVENQRTLEEQEVKDAPDSSREKPALATEALSQDSAHSSSDAEA
ncbi:MAG: signal peptidase II [Planctomycetota bacterium]|nr:signal peptidase II [Planctomycetota bacterium]